MRRRLRPHRTLVLGGVRSGKSAWAQRQLASARAVTYLATARHYPDDAEWSARLAAHRADRPAHWTTIENVDLETVLRTATGPLLVDDLGNWLTTAMDEAGAWDNERGLSAVHDRVAHLVDAWATARMRAVLVSNEVGHGVVPGTRAGRLFRDELGMLNARLAAVSDEVVLLVAGLPVRLRPQGRRRSRSPDG